MASKRGCSVVETVPASPPVQLELGLHVVHMTACSSPGEEPRAPLEVQDSWWRARPSMVEASLRRHTRWAPKAASPSRERTTRRRDPCESVFQPSPFTRRCRRADPRGRSTVAVTRTRRRRGLQQRRTQPRTGFAAAAANGDLGDQHRTRLAARLPDPPVTPQSQRQGASREVRRGVEDRLHGSDRRVAQRGHRELLPAVSTGLGNGPAGGSVRSALLA